MAKQKKSHRKDSMTRHAPSAAAIDRLFSTAVQYHQEGHVRKAEALYKKIIKGKPEHADALHMSGVLKRQQKGFDDALILIRKAIVINPLKAEYHCSLGDLYKDTKKTDEAITCYHQAIKLRPDHAESYIELGDTLRIQGKYNNAVRCFRQAIEIKPDSSDAFFYLGNTLHLIEKYEEAVDCFRHAIEINPDFAEAYYNLGIELRLDHKITDAIKSFQRAVRIRPDYADALNNLGTALAEIGEYGDGILCLKRAAEIRPDSVDIHFNLGWSLQGQNMLTEAVNQYKKILELNPSHFPTYVNMGEIFKDIGFLTEALVFFQKALELRPDNSLSYSNILLTLHYADTIDPDDVFAQHQKWADRYESPLKDTIPPHVNDRSPDRQIRIGYVSPDLYDHSVAYFFKPVLASHNKAQFKIYCYSDTKRPDATTKDLKGLTDQWHDIHDMDDDKAEDLIRGDKIDILVDLAGHTSNNRLTLFARKPAPVQVTYLGYPDTTGLEAMDYRITDSYADTPGKTDYLHTEELVRLPNSFLCYSPPDNTPDVGGLPLSKTGSITFGSFNTRAKMTPRTIRAWSRILDSIPSAGLVLKSKTLHDNKAREILLEMFAQNNISAERIKLFGPILDKTGHLELYNSIDIALDTFPYNGTTTTCEALWMGVPVITLKGDIHVSRVGLSILANVGLAELIAESEEEYIQKAIELADNIERLKYLRTNLRSMMLGSSLMDARGFTRNLEHEYHRMWQRWCNNEQTTIFESQKNTMPDQAESLTQRGEALFSNGNAEDALVAFNRAIKINPNNTTALNNLGVLYWHTGDIPRAVEHFKMALQINPDYEDARFNLKEVMKIFADNGQKVHKNDFMGK